MNCASNDSAVGVSVVLVLSQHFYSFFDIYCPASQYCESIFFVAISLDIIVVKSFDSLAVDVVEGFHILSVTVDGMDIGEPSCVQLLDGRFDFKGCLFYGLEFLKFFVKFLQEI